MARMNKKYLAFIPRKVLYWFRFRFIIDNHLYCIHCDYKLNRGKCNFCGKRSVTIECDNDLLEWMKSKDLKISDDKTYELVRQLIENKMAKIKIE